MEAHVFDKMSCPSCGFEHMMGVKVSDNKRGMNSGDFGMCGKCGSFLRVIIVNKKAMFRIPLEVEVKMYARVQPIAFYKTLLLREIRQLKKGRS